MKFPSREEQKKLVRQMEEGWREVERIRNEALRGLPYNWKDVDDLLAMGDNYDGPPRLTSGLEEQQRLFMKSPKHPKNLKKA